MKSQTEYPPWFTNHVLDNYKDDISVLVITYNNLVPWSIFQLMHTKDVIPPYISSFIPCGLPTHAYIKTIQRKWHYILKLAFTQSKHTTLHTLEKLSQTCYSFFSFIHCRTTKEADTHFYFTKISQTRVLRFLWIKAWEYTGLKGN